MRLHVNKDQYEPPLGLVILTSRVSKSGVLA